MEEGESTISDAIIANLAIGSKACSPHAAKYVYMHLCI